MKQDITTTSEAQDTTTSAQEAAVWDDQACREIAALLALDIDIFCTTISECQDKPMMAMQLAKKLKQRKDQILADAEVRARRYQATGAVLGAKHLGPPKEK